MSWFVPGVGRVDYPSGSGTLSVALGDLDGDGKLDIVTANSESNTVSVLVGTGGGRFAAKVDYPCASPSAPGQRNSIALRDLNGDGKPDIVTASYYSNALSVLLGVGDGTLAAMSAYPGGGHPTSVAVADLNEDGKLDLLATSFDTRCVSSLFGIGDGTFDVGPSYPTGGRPQMLALGDLNDDGDQDIVTVSPDTSTVSVLLGTGDGGLATHVDRIVEGISGSAAMGDVDGDGKLDVVAGNSSNSTVSVLLGTGDGRLAPKVDYATGYTPVALALGDLNGDHALDVVTVNAAGAVSMLLGRGDGTLAAQIEYAATFALPPPGDGTGPSLGSLVLSDLNRDGKPDLVMTSTVATHGERAAQRFSVGTARVEDAGRRPTSSAWPTPRKPWARGRALACCACAAATPFGK